MQASVAAGAGFLLTVLRFDFVFDVQTRKHLGGPLPAEVLSRLAIVASGPRPG
jgi:hypothetical protein